MMDEDFWFSKKEKKFLHNIDTFYFSVKLHDDFTEAGTALNVEQLRRVCNKYSGMANETPFREVEYDSSVLYRKGKYGFFYTFWLESPEQFDFLFAPVVPVGAETVASVTSEIIVQIRARMLWELGAKLAFDKAMEFVRAFCNRFDLSIAEVKENRTDFCWHTNALQDPEHYLNIERFRPMCVCRFPAAGYRYQLKHDDEYENDYMSLGNRGDKCFVRIYLKTKEVVEQGYKGWFLYTWFFNGMISRYGVFKFASSLDHVGVLARSVKDCAIVVDEMKGLDKLDMTTWDSSTIKLTEGIEDEINNNLFTIKNMATTEQQTLPLEDVLKYILENK